MLTRKLAAEYECLTQSAGYVLLDDRTVMILRGKDRLAFLHNFCTADVKSLVAGKCSEAFVLNQKGKLLGHVHLLSLSDELIVETVGRQFETLHEHFDKYLMREDVTIENGSSDRAVVFVAGPKSESLLNLESTTLPGPGEVIETEFLEKPLTIANLDLAGHGYQVILPNSVLSDFENRLSELGLLRCSAEALEIRRLENKTPWFGIDANDDNLPQELQRDAQAISFTKGCYLGQETVARIDAIGHVNRLLVGLKLNQDAEPGIELEHEGSAVGKLTSIAWSPDHESWMAIGYVRRKFAAAGSTVNFGELGHAEVLP